jgi:four helix bundle protein
MEEIQKGKKYDLEDRTYKYASDVRLYCRSFDKSDSLIWDDIRQLIRSSGSVGANYIEANEALSKKDFLLRVKISRKEVKESIYWLRLLPLQGRVDKEKDRLIGEATELMKIFGAIIEKSK